MICEPFDVVTVPFPFSEMAGSKRRPALVLSQKKFNDHGHSILSMITTQSRPSWPTDLPIGDQKAAGLRMDCILRFKLFTLDNRLLVNKIGRLSESDQAAVKQLLHSILADR